MFRIEMEMYWFYFYYVQFIRILCSEMFGSKMEGLCTSNIGRGHTCTHTVTQSRDKNRKRGDKKYV
jgi:hypothetical protein